MVDKTEIKYQYACDITGRVVDVKTLVKDQVKEKKYQCVACGESLTPVLGEIRQKHFRHVAEADCSRESYLHQLGKLLFLQTFRHCLATNTPFVIELPEQRICTHCGNGIGPCQLTPYVKPYNLVESFKSIELEKPDGAFVPDILLTDEAGQKLYIEIAVSHPCEEAKKDSGNRIIELSVTDEEDLRPITDCLLSGRDHRVDFFNFQVTHVGDFSDSCPITFAFFLVYSTGKCVITEKNVMEVKRQSQNGKLVHFQAIPAPYDPSFAFKHSLETAYWQGVPVKNCFLCRYHGRNFKQDIDGLPIYCKWLRQRHLSTEAAECIYFRADPTVFPLGIEAPDKRNSADPRGRQRKEVAR